MISQRTRDALAAKKAQGVKLGGLNAKGIANRDEAKARAEALRPVLTELAGMSANAIAAELNARKSRRQTAAPGTQAALSGFRTGWRINHDQSRQHQRPSPNHG